MDEPNRRERLRQSAAKTKIRVRRRVRTITTAVRGFLHRLGQRIRRAIFRPQVETVVAAVLGSSFGRLIAGLYLTVVFAVAGWYVSAVVWALYACFELWMYLHASGLLGQVVKVEASFRNFADEMATATAA